MHHRVNTELDESLVRRARLESLRQGRPFDQILEEALERYLNEKGISQRDLSVVAETWGALSVKRDLLESILEEDDGLFGA